LVNIKIKKHIIVKFLKDNFHFYNTSLYVVLLVVKDNEISCGTAWRKWDWSYKLLTGSAVDSTRRIIICVGLCLWKQ